MKECSELGTSWRVAMATDWFVDVCLCRVANTSCGARPAAGSSVRLTTSKSTSFLITSLSNMSILILIILMIVFIVTLSSDAAAAVTDTSLPVILSVCPSVCLSACIINSVRLSMTWRCTLYSILILIGHVGLLTTLSLLMMMMMMMIIDAWV